MSRTHQAIRKAQEQFTSTKAEALPRQNLVEIAKELTNEFVVERRLVERIHGTREQGSSGSLTQFEGFPKLTISPDAKVVTITAVGSPASGEYRRLSGRLEQWEEGDLRTVIVAGSRGGEGATVTATNLSLALAQDSTRKVLLVDANIAHPGISSLLGFPNQVEGLSQFLAADVSITGVVYRTEISNFCVTPSGSALESNQNPLTAKMEAFVGQVSERFDWVVIDSPPIASGSFEVLSQFTDGVLLVVKAMETSSKELSASLSRLQKTRLLGFVLNEVASLRKSNFFYSEADSHPL
jgi:succinoglycan biosynthesis transport protein ExoP